MTTNANRTVPSYAGKELQILPMRTDGIYYSLSDVIHSDARTPVTGENEKHILRRHHLLPTSESRALTLNDMFLLVCGGVLLLKWVDFTKSSLTAGTALLSKEHETALYSPLSRLGKLSFRKR